MVSSVTDSILIPSICRHKKLISTIRKTAFSFFLFFRIKNFDRSQGNTIVHIEFIEGNNEIVNLKIYFIIKNICNTNSMSLIPF